MNKAFISNLIYLFLAILFLTLGVYFQKKELSLGLIITEYLIVLLPAIIFSFAFKKESIKNYLRLNTVSLKKIILAMGITIFTYPIAVFGNLIVLSILNYFGKYNIPQVPFASSENEYFWFLFLMGITPGICEEILFRGFFLKVNEDKGIRWSIIYTSFLFALFHFNIYNFAAPFVLGIVFGYMTIITNSIYPSIISHALNNSIATTIGYLVLKKAGNIPVIQDKIRVQIILSQLVFFGISALVSFFIVKKLFRKIRDKDVVEENNMIRSSSYEYIPVMLCIVMYIYIFVKFQ